MVGDQHRLNQELEKAGRVADFLELAEVMILDALDRRESAGVHFRVEYATETGEVKRNDADWCMVSAWKSVLLGWARLGAGLVGRTIVGLWIDMMRAVPMLLLIYFFLLAVPRFGPTLPPFWMLVIPIVMCTSATTAEVFRSGVLALDRGQSEAATVLGLGRGQTMRLILAPQALRLMLPTLVTQLVTILKDSSLGYIVSYAELMYAKNYEIGRASCRERV